MVAPMSNYMRYAHRDTGYPTPMGELFDVCAKRHKNNPESDRAFQSIRDILTKREQQVFDIIQLNTNGITAEEVADIMGVSVNTISGRCSRLKFIGRIRKNGTRSTRSGNRAAVLVAI